MAEAKIDIKRTEEPAKICNDCSGKGLTPGGLDVAKLCKTCNGSGKL